MIYMAMFRHQGNVVSVCLDKYPTEVGLPDGATDFKVKSLGNYTKEEIIERMALGLILPIKGYGVHPDEIERNRDV